MSAKREKTLRRARRAAPEQQTLSRQPMQAPTEPSPALATSWGRFAQGALQEMLAVSYWFDPLPGQRWSSVRIRFSGRRTGIGARMGPRDRFVCDETVNDVGDKSGWISVTARLHGIEPGEWITSATVIDADSGTRNPGGRPVAARPGLDLHPAAWSWRQWSLNDRPSASVRTCLAPAIQVPGLVPFIWGPLMLLGVILGLLLQVVIVSGAHLSIGRTLAVSAVALVAGAVGARLWYTIIKRREHRYNGWCIQGFLVTFAVVAPAIAAAIGVSIGTFLDVSAPGIFLGAFVGRVGCFLAGCCGGRPTTSRWGVWSSDQRVGRRRIPTQLMEAGLAATVSLGSLTAILRLGPRGGGLFVASISAYTLVRQFILRLREERRTSVLLGPIVTAAAAAVLFTDMIFLSAHPR